MIRILALLGAVLSLGGCITLGINGTARPNANTAVSVGTSIGPNGISPPRGRVSVGLF